MGWVDLHNHLLPHVDDGASDLDESRAALRTMVDAGVSTVVVSPHLPAQVTAPPSSLQAALARVDEAFERLSGVVAAEFPKVRLARGVELMLDTPSAELEDER